MTEQDVERIAGSGDTDDLAIALSDCIKEMQGLRKQIEMNNVARSNLNMRLRDAEVSYRKLKRYLMKDFHDQSKNA